MKALRILQSSLEDSVAELVATAGFKREKAVFRRLVDGGSQTFHLSFIEHRQDFDVTADVALRYDDVEILIAQTLGIEISTNQEMSVGAELGNIAEGHQKRWTVSVAEEIPAAVSGIMNAFQSIAEPALQAMSDRHYALSLLERDDKRGWLFMPVHAQRAMLALALCAVLGDKSSFERVTKQKQLFLTQKRDPQLDKVMAFADKLHHQIWNA